MASSPVCFRWSWTPLCVWQVFVSYDTDLWKIVSVLVWDLTIAFSDEIALTKDPCSLFNNVCYNTELLCNFLGFIVEMVILFQIPRSFLLVVDRSSKLSYSSCAFSVPSDSNALLLLLQKLIIISSCLFTFYNKWDLLQECTSHILQLCEDSLHCQWLNLSKSIRFLKNRLVFWVQNLNTVKNGVLHYTPGALHHTGY